MSDPRIPKGAALPDLNEKEPVPSPMSDLELVAFHASLMEQEVERLMKERDQAREAMIRSHADYLSLIRNQPEHVRDLRIRYEFQLSYNQELRRQIDDLTDKRRVEADDRLLLRESLAEFIDGLWARWFNGLMAAGGRSLLTYEHFKIYQRQVQYPLALQPTEWKEFARKEADLVLSILDARAMKEGEDA